MGDHSDAGTGSGGITRRRGWGGGCQAGGRCWVNAAVDLESMRVAG